MVYAAGFFRERVKELSGGAIADLPDGAVRSILEEAARRAGEKEKDGVPRAARFMDEVGGAAACVVKIVTGDGTVDPRIRAILQFHSVK